VLADAEISAISTVLRRVFARRVFSDHDLDELVQETLTRIVKSEPGLAGEELVAYAIVTARNTLIAAGRRRRDHPRALADDDLLAMEDPAALAVGSFEGDALRQALASLPEHDRQMLVDHVVEGRTTDDLAAGAGTTAGAIAARLARARARARVDYVVALRNVSLPTERCHDVLVSLSSGLRRRQVEVSAADHLLSCTTCAELAPPVVERRRSLAALVPVLGLPAALGRLRRALASRPVVGVGVATGAVVAVVAGTAGVAGIALRDAEQGEDASAAARSTSMATATTAGPAPPPTAPTASNPATTSPVTEPSPPSPAPGASPPGASGTCQLVDGTGALADPGALSGLIGGTVTLRTATVTSAPGTAGFWTQCGSSQIWIQVIGLPLGAPPVIAGHQVGVVGVVVPHGTGYAAAVGVTAAEGAGDLDAVGVHVEAPADSLRVTG
jgi:serine/threonine-protein kinase RsbT